MRPAALLLRIRVITESTRAAVRSLKPDDTQLSEVVERGRLLLGRLEPLVLEHDSEEVASAFARARSDLDSLRGRG
jgi:hypothetical protein